MKCPRPSNLLLVLAAAVAMTSAYAHDLKRSEANQIISEGEYLVKNGRQVHAFSSRRYAGNDRKKKKSKAYPATTHRVTRHSAPKPRVVAKHTPKKTPKRYPASEPKRSSKRRSKHSSHAPKRVTKHESKRSPRHATKMHSHKPDHRSASTPKRRFPVARETSNERDMPFVSIPHRRVGSADRTIVMDDPAVRAPLPKPARVGAAIRPDNGVLDPSQENSPSSVGDAKAAAAPPLPAIVGPAPASVVGSEVAAPVDTSEAAVSHAAAETATREPDAFDLHSGQDPMARK